MFQDESAGKIGRRRDRRRLRLSGIKIPHAREDIVLCEIPYHAAEMAALSKKKQIRIWGRIAEALLMRSVRCVYLPKRLIDYGAEEMLDGRFLLPGGDAVFCAMIPALLKKATETREIELAASEVGIWQSYFDAKGFAVFAAIADTARYVTLYTKHIESAQRYADEVYDRCGLSAGVVAWPGNIARCDAVVLLDPPMDVTLSEGHIIIDPGGQYRPGGINGVTFSVPFGFAALEEYFDRFDQRAIAFLLYACDMADTTDIAGAIKGIGCGIGSMMYAGRRY
jgi:hypothetical protein